MTIGELIGKMFFELRKQKDLTQEQVADSIHVSQPVYARIENGIGNSWAIYIDSLCGFFEIPFEEFIINYSDNIQENTEQKEATAHHNPEKFYHYENLLEEYKKQVKELENRNKALEKILTSQSKPR